MTRTQQGYDRNGRVVRYIYPSVSRVWNFGYNELGQRSRSIDPGDFTTYINHDANGFESEHILPGSQKTLFYRDRNGGATLIFYPDGTTLFNQFSYFGVPTSHTDLSGAVETLTNDKKMQCVERSSIKGDHGKTLRVSIYSQMTSDGIKWKATTTNPVLGHQDIQSTYVVGRLVEQNDVSSEKRSVNHYDLEGQLIKRTLYENDKPVRALSCILNGLGQETLSYDNQLMLAVYYDLGGNRVQIASELSLGYKIEPIKQSRWNSYSVTNNVVIDGGELVNGQIIRGSGREYTYQSGLRATELQGTVRSILNYDRDNLLIDVTQGSKVIHRDYNKQLEVTYIKATTPTALAANEIDEYALVYDINGNGWQTQQTYTKNNVLQSSVNFQGLTQRGLPTLQSTVSQSYDEDNHWQAEITDSLTHRYVNFEEPKLSRVSGTRTVRTEGETKVGDYTSVSVYPDVNGTTSVITGQQDPDSPDSKYGDLVLMQTTTDGLILNKQVYHSYGNPDGMTTGGSVSNYFTVNNQYLGNYDSRHFHVSMSSLHQVVTDFGGKERGVTGYWQGQTPSRPGEVARERPGTGRGGAWHIGRFTISPEFDYADPTPSVVYQPASSATHAHPALEFTFPPPVAVLMSLEVVVEAYVHGGNVSRVAVGEAGVLALGTFGAGLGGLAGAVVGGPYR